MLYSQTFFMLTFPTLEEKIPASSFGTPKLFRASQNTTCYVRLNIRFEFGNHN